MATKISNIKVVKGGIIKNWWKLNSVNSNVSSDHNQGDEDFHTFWYSICYVLGLLNVYRRLFGDISANELMLRRFLQSKEIAFKNNNTFEEFVYLFDNWCSEIQKRGTYQVNLGKGQSNEIGIFDPISTGTIQSIIDTYSGLGIVNFVNDHVGNLNTDIALGTRHIIEFDMLAIDSNSDPLNIDGHLFNGVLTGLRILRLTAPVDFISSFQFTYTSDFTSVSIVCNVVINQKNTIKLVRNANTILLYINDILVGKELLPVSTNFTINNLFTVGLPTVANIKLIQKDQYFDDVKIWNWKCNEGSGVVLECSDSAFNAYLVISALEPWDECWQRYTTFNNTLYSGIDGELKRLLNYSSGEYLHELLATSELGFVMDISSPLSEEASGVNLNKMYNKGNLNHLSNFPFTGESVIPFLLNNEVVFELTAASGIRSGMNAIFDSVDDWRDIADVKPIGLLPFLPIPIGTNTDNINGYEFSFSIISTDVIKLKVMFNFYDEDLAKIVSPTLDLADDAPTTVILDDQLFPLCINEKIWLRGLYLTSPEADNPIVTNLGIGHTIYSDNPAIRFILPIISFEYPVGTSCTVKLSDIVLRPLSLNTTKGVISNKNTVISYIKNESGQSDMMVSEFIDKKLLPYNCNTNIQFL